MVSSISLKIGFVSSTIYQCVQSYLSYMGAQIFAAYHRYFSMNVSMKQEITQINKDIKDLSLCIDKEQIQPKLFPDVSLKSEEIRNRSEIIAGYRVLLTALKTHRYTFSLLKNGLANNANYTTQRESLKALYQSNVGASSDSAPREIPLPASLPLAAKPPSLDFFIQKACDLMPELGSPATVSQAIQETVASESAFNSALQGTESLLQRACDLMPELGSPASVTQTVKEIMSQTEKKEEPSKCEHQCCDEEAISALQKAVNRGKVDENSYEEVVGALAKLPIAENCDCPVPKKGDLLAIERSILENQKSLLSELKRGGRGIGCPILGLLRLYDLWRSLKFPPTHKKTNELIELPIKSKPKNQIPISWPKSAHPLKQIPKDFLTNTRPSNLQDKKWEGILTKAVSHKLFVNMSEKELQNLFYELYKLLVPQEKELYPTFWRNRETGMGCCGDYFMPQSFKAVISHLKQEGDLANSQRMVRIAHMAFRYNDCKRKVLDLLSTKEWDLFVKHAYIGVATDTIGQNMSGFFKKLAGHLSNPSLHPYQIAAFIHYGITKIRPFGQGNGAIARLFANVYLMQNGLSPFIVKDREAYLACYKTPKFEEAFINFLEHKG